MSVFLLCQIGGDFTVSLNPFKVFKKDDSLIPLYDPGLFDDTSQRIQMKHLAIQTCINLIARTIYQSEFRMKENGETLKDETYYHLNVRPNENMSKSDFWQKFIYKLIYDNEVLVVQSDTEDLLIADDFSKVEYGIMGTKFKDVIINNFTYGRTFDMRDVIYVPFQNDDLMRILSSVYDDYGELIGRLIDFHKHKNQVRSTVSMENVNSKDPETQNKLQQFIDKMYSAIKNKSFAIVPQQKGFEYEEHSTSQSGQSIEEINKATGGFLDDVAMALGIPASLIRGDMSDVEDATRNYMTFCIDPFLEKIKDELNAKLITKQDYLNGKHMDIRRVSYSNMFDVAGAVDKLRSAGVANGNELREELGLPKVDDPILNEYYITRNYREDGEGNKGGGSNGE